MMKYKSARDIQESSLIPCDFHALVLTSRKIQCLRPRRNKRLRWKYVRGQSAHPVSGSQTAVICFNLWVYVCRISFKYTHSKGNQSLCC